MLTRRLLIGLIVAFALSLCLETTSSAQTPAQIAAQKKRAAQLAKKRALQQQKQRQARQAQPRGSALDQEALDTTPTFEKIQPKDASSIARTIDEFITAKLEEKGIPASPLADDAEFMRRGYLDITGKIPPPGKVAAFLQSRDPQKRAKLVDELLESDQYGQHMAEIWTALMVERFTNNRRISFDPLTQWLRDQFNENRSWDKVVSDIITAEGNQDKNGAVTYFLANTTPDKMTDSVCRVFLGVQLQCAQCHNHPFTDWKQDEYWAMAQFFMKVQPQRNRNNQLKNGAVPGITEVKTAPRRVRGLPESAKMVPAKFLQGDKPDLEKTDPYRPVLAEWMTRAENPFFAKAMVNRLWGQFFGRGIVNPVDDMHLDNLPSHPELLKGLSESFSVDFDVKQLIRGICASQTYQRTSRPVEGNADDEKYFSHMAMKVMTPEQLYDSLTQVLGEPGGNRPNARNKAQARRGLTLRDRFVQFFQVGDDPDLTKYEVGIPQALRLMNSNITARAEQAVGRLVPPNATPAHAITNLYLATLSRQPTQDELQRMVGHVAGESNARSAYGDILWALLNSSEFTLNH